MIKDIIQIAEFYKKTSQDKVSREALYSNLKKELYFNLEIFDEMKRSKAKDEKLSKFILLLKTDFYDTIKQSLIKIETLKKPIDIDMNEIIDDDRLSNKNFKRWVVNIKTDLELIEKVYLKTSVLKALASIGVTKREQSYQYVKFLMIILKKVLK